MTWPTRPPTSWSRSPGIEGPLRGYYNGERSTYDALVENAIVRRYIEANDVLEGL